MVVAAAASNPSIHSAAVHRLTLKLIEIEQLAPIKLRAIETVLDYVLKKLREGS